MVSSCLSRVHFFCMGPAFFRLSSGFYRCLTAYLWYLFFCPPLIRAEYYLPGGLVCQHGSVYPAVGELHLRLLHDIVHGDPLQWPWVLLGFIKEALLQFSPVQVGLLVRGARKGFWELWKGVWGDYLRHCFHLKKTQKCYRGTPAL